jgi:hypothetical protein
MFLRNRGRPVRRTDNITAICEAHCLTTLQASTACYRVNNSVAFVRERIIPSDRRLSARLVPNFADTGCHVVSVTDPYGCIRGFLDRSRYFFFKVAPQLYS